MNMFSCSFFSSEFFQPAPNSPSPTLLTHTDMITASGSSAVFLLLHSSKPQEIKCKEQAWNERLVYKLYTLTAEIWSTQSFSNTLPAHTPQIFLSYNHMHTYMRTYIERCSKLTLAKKQASDISVFTFKIIRILFSFLKYNFFDTSSFWLHCSYIFQWWKRKGSLFLFYFKVWSGK